MPDLLSSFVCFTDSVVVKITLTCCLFACRTMNSTESITLYLQNDRIFLWNADDADKVRKDHRIVGTPVGCLPRSPFQNGCLGLPVQLSMEEAHLLVVKGLAILVKNNRLSKEPTNDDKSRLEKFADDIYHEQAELVMSQRREEIIQYADRIVAGMYFKTTGQYISKRMRRKMKKARLQGEGPSSVSEQTLPEPPSVDIEAQREAVISQQMKTVVPPTRDITYTPVLTECPRTRENDLEPATLDYPSTEEETLRFKVFQDLWEKGHHLTSGSKFGGDFLVYSGDPLLFHSYAIVVCLGRKTSFGGQDLIMWGRLGNTVHKTVILASLADDQVQYLSLGWAGYI